MQIEEAKEYLKNYKYDNEVREAIDTVLNELEKKDKEYEELTEASKELCKTVNLMKKVINEMAEYMEQEMAEYQLDDIYSELHNCNGMERNWTRGKEAEIKDIKEYFTKKAEKGE